MRIAPTETQVTVHQTETGVAMVLALITTAVALLLILTGTTDMMLTSWG